MIVAAVAAFVIDWSGLDAQQRPADVDSVRSTAKSNTTAVNGRGTTTSGNVATPNNESGVKNALETVETLLQILAYLIAGGWVYFNFFKGRTYRPRLELRVLGHLARATTPHFVIAILQIKNVGLSKVDVSKEGNAFRILVFDPEADGQWRHIATLPLLQSHQWIEPSEALEEQALLPLSLEGIPAVRVEAIVTGTNTMWEAFTIVL